MVPYGLIIRVDLLVEEEVVEAMERISIVDGPYFNR